MKAYPQECERIQNITVKINQIPDEELIKATKACYILRTFLVDVGEKVKSEGWQPFTINVEERAKSYGWQLSREKVKPLCSTR